MAFQTLAAENSIESTEIKNINNKIKKRGNICMMQNNTKKETFELRVINDTSSELIAKLRKCRNCGRYFVLPDKSSAVYCDRKPNNSDKTCKEIGAAYTRRIRLIKKYINRIFTSAYNKNYKKIKHNICTKQEFIYWSAKAREHRNKCLSGEITLKTFREWLREENI